MFQYISFEFEKQVKTYIKSKKENMTKKDREEHFSEKEALVFHAQGKPGKIEIKATKPLETQRDLSLAYSPGVAAPVNAIADDTSTVYDYTSKGNIVAVYQTVPQY